MIQQPANHEIEDYPHPQASIVRSWIDQTIRQIVSQSRAKERVAMSHMQHIFNVIRHSGYANSGKTKDMGVIGRLDDGVNIPM
jgi:hypothetical protein